VTIHRLNGPGGGKEGTQPDNRKENSELATSLNSPKHRAKPFDGV
jgi:hypothetical protein